LAIDPSSRSFRDRLNLEHAATVEKSAALSKAIARDEAAVDTAVFELYQLTAAQRALVEGGA
jgi:hypothetical protein